MRKRLSAHTTREGGPIKLRLGYEKKALCLGRSTYRRNYLTVNWNKVFISESMADMCMGIRRISEPAREKGTNFIVWGIHTTFFPAFLNECARLDIPFLIASGFTDCGWLDATSNYACSHSSLQIIWKSAYSTQNRAQIAPTRTFVVNMTHLCDWYPFRS